MLLVEANSDQLGNHDWNITGWQLFAKSYILCNCVSYGMIHLVTLCWFPYCFLVVLWQQVLNAISRVMGMVFTPCGMSESSRHLFFKCYLTGCSFVLDIASPWLDFPYFCWLLTLRGRGYLLAARNLVFNCSRCSTLDGRRAAEDLFTSISSLISLTYESCSLVSVLVLQSKVQMYSCAQATGGAGY